MKSNRPVNRDVTKYRFPLTAIISILHRVSGMVLFLALPWLLYLLAGSLASEARFFEIQSQLSQPLYKFLIWAILAAVSFHGVAGFRHMIMDLGFAESLKAGKIGALITVLISGFLMILVGVWLW